MIGGDAVISIETPIGRLGVEATEIGVSRVRLPGDGVHPQAAHGNGQAGDNATDAARQLGEYLRGEREDLEIALDWKGVTPDHRRVLETLGDIAPFGTTVTYGELGRRAGVEDPRDVGVLMARNPIPLVIPCHRVVASDGLGGYGGGLELKRRLLELEGVLPAPFDLAS